MAIRVYDLAFDGGNISELAHHGLQPRDVWEVLDNRPVFAVNKRGRVATMLMIGPTTANRFLTIPLAPAVGEHGLWRPETGWVSEPEERTKYDRRFRW